MTEHEPGSLAEHLHQQAVANRDRTVEDWTTRARFARECRELSEPLPAWSTGELLAVAVINEDQELLDQLDYTFHEALDRIRYDIGASLAVATQIIASIRKST